METNIDAKQGLLILLATTCLFANVVSANDGSINHAANKNVGDLSQLSTTKDSKLDTGKFAGELRTSANPTSGKVAINKSDASKAMISKFRINGI
jgi:hypothetical protein